MWNLYKALCFVEPGELFDVATIPSRTDKQTFKTISKSESFEDLLQQLCAKTLTLKPVVDLQPRQPPLPRFAGELIPISNSQALISTHRHH